MQKSCPHCVHRITLHTKTATCLSLGAWHHERFSESRPLPHPRSLVTRHRALVSLCASRWRWCCDRPRCENRPLRSYYYVGSSSYLCHFVSLTGPKGGQFAGLAGTEISPASATRTLQGSRCGLDVMIFVTNVSLNDVTLQQNCTNIE